MNIIERILSSISYIILMMIGFFFFLTFTILGIYILASTGNLIDKIWNALQQAIPSLSGVDIPKSLIIFIIEIPFIILSLFGLVVILLTQRTVSAKRLARKK